MGKSEIAITTCNIILIYSITVHYTNLFNIDAEQDIKCQQKYGFGQ